MLIIQQEASMNGPITRFNYTSIDAEVYNRGLARLKQTVNPIFFFRVFLNYLGSTELLWIYLLDFVISITLAIFIPAFSISLSDTFSASISAFHSIYHAVW